MAEHLRDAVASGEATLSAEWLARSGARVLAQESGRHLEPNEAVMVARAFSDAGAEALLAIVNDALASSAEAYELEVTADDLTKICSDFVGVNFVLVNPAASECILFTAYDFKLVAGSPAFVNAVAGDPHSARNAFLEFAEDQPGALRDTAAQAAEYMSWVVNPE